jgi:hypothetical protein
MPFDYGEAVGEKDGWRAKSLLHSTSARAAAKVHIR